MTISTIYDLLVFEEGERLTVYDDATGQPIVPGSVVQGHPTIGVGVRLDAPDGITESESIILLGDRVGTVTLALAAHPWYIALDPIRRWAIVSMAFAMGVDGVLEFKDMIAALQAQDWPAAQAAVVDSDWWINPQTQARATRVANMILNGAWPTV